MESINTDKIISYYNERATKARESGHATLLDDNLRKLEIETVKKWLKPDDRVLEIFCGNGVSTLELAGFCREIVACDLSEKMLEWAQHNLAEYQPPRTNVTFRHGNVMDIDTMFTPGEFDAVISIRGVSNLPTRELQKEAILKVHKLLPPKGKYLFIEGDRDGLARINAMREQFSLKPISEPWYDNYFVEPELSDFLRQHFTIREERKLDIYFLVSRVLYPLAAQPDEPSFDHLTNTVARMLVPYADTNLGTSLLRCLYLEKNG